MTEQYQFTIPYELFYLNSWGESVLNLALKHSLEDRKSYKKDNNPNNYHDYAGYLKYKQKVENNIKSQRESCLLALNRLLDDIKKFDLLPIAATNIKSSQQFFWTVAGKLLRELKALYILDSEKFGYQDLQIFCHKNPKDHDIFFDQWFPKLKKDLGMPNTMEDFKKSFKKEVWEEILKDVEKTAIRILKPETDIPSLYQNPNPITIGLFQIHLQNVYFTAELALQLSSRDINTFVIDQLESLHVLLQQHIPEYNSEWNDLITSVDWLLRNGSFWSNPHKPSVPNLSQKFEVPPLRIPYDFMPFEKERLELYEWKNIENDTIPLFSPTPDEQKCIEELRQYFEIVLKNVEKILNIKFEPHIGKLHTPSTSVQKPQLRLIFYKASTFTTGLAHFPGDKDGGGDIWIRINEIFEDGCRPLDDLQKTLLHELGHALGLSHFHANSRSDCQASIMGRKVSSAPPCDRSVMGTLYHKFANYIWTVMGYDEYSNYDSKHVETDAHLGAVDYMTLLCAYGPNFKNQDLKHIKESWLTGKLSLRDVSLKNFEKIKKILSKRYIKYSKITLPANMQVEVDEEGFNNIPVDKTKSDKIIQEKNLFIKCPSSRLVTNVSSILDGFSKSRTRLKRFEDNECRDFDLIYDSCSVIYSFTGSKGQDAVLFNQNIKAAYGKDGHDLYCFYKDKWGQHIIAEDKGINFIIFYETDEKQLICRRRDQDLLIIDQKVPQNKRAVKLKGYFKDNLYKKSNTLLSSYTILTVQNNLLAKEFFLWQKRRKYIGVLNPLKLSQLRPGQPQVLSQFF